MVLASLVQAARELPTALITLESYPAGWEPVGYAILALLAGFFLFTVVGLWRMRRWALVARLLVHVIAPVQMTLAWNESWASYPMLGPFVSWFWFGVIALCTVPYWKQMTWRFP
jgi:hypothetical protein